MLGKSHPRHWHFACASYGWTTILCTTVMCPHLSVPVSSLGNIGCPCKMVVLPAASSPLILKGLRINTTVGLWVLTLWWPYTGWGQTRLSFAAKCLSRGLTSMAAKNFTDLYRDNCLSVVGMLEEWPAWRRWQRLHRSSFYPNGTLVAWVVLLKGLYMGWWRQVRQTA